MRHDDDFGFCDEYVMAEQGRLGRVLMWAAVVAGWLIFGGLLVGTAGCGNAPTAYIPAPPAPVAHSSIDSLRGVTYTREIGGVGTGTLGFPTWNVHQWNLDTGQDVFAYEGPHKWIAAGTVVMADEPCTLGGDVRLPATYCIHEEDEGIRFVNHSEPYYVSTGAPLCSRATLLGGGVWHEVAPSTAPAPGAMR